MAATFKRGDAVRWNTSQGETRGTIVRRVTGKTKAGGHTAKATAAAPQYEVRSSRTGKSAIHKPAALRKAR